MATQTPNYGLTKPETTDYYDVGVFNDNADKIDEELDKTRLVPLFTSESGISSGNIGLSQNYTDFKRLVFVYNFYGLETKSVFLDHLGSQNILLRAFNLYDSELANVNYGEMKIGVTSAQLFSILSNAYVTFTAATGISVRDDADINALKLIAVYGSYI